MGQAVIVWICIVDLWTALDTDTDTDTLLGDGDRRHWVTLGSQTNKQHLISPSAPLCPPYFNPSLAEPIYLLVSISFVKVFRGRNPSWRKYLAGRDRNPAADER